MQIEAKTLALITLGLGLAYILHQHWNLKEDVGKMERFLLLATGQGIPASAGGGGMSSPSPPPAVSRRSVMPAQSMQNLVPQSSRRVSPSAASSAAGVQGKVPGGVHPSVFNPAMGDDPDELVDLGLAGASAKRR